MHGERRGGVRGRFHKGVEPEGGPRQNGSYFHNGKSGVLPRAHIVVDEVRVPVGPNIKYLDLTLDRRWGFVEHFDKLAPRLGGRADALLGLMPNFRGPNASVRQAYMHAVLSGPY